MRSVHYLIITLFCTVTSLHAQTSLYHTEDDALYRKGLDLLEKSDYAAARETFEKYVRQSSDNMKKADAEYYIAFSALSLFHQDGEKLIEKFIRDHESHPKSSLAYFELGDFYFKQKSYNKAIEYLAKVNYSALSNEERNTAQFQLAYSYFALRKFDDALPQFDALKRRESAYKAPASYYAGYINYENQSYDQAIEDLKRAGENEAYASVVPGMIASIYYNQKRYDELIRYSEQVLSGSDRVNERDFYLLTADAYLYQKNFEKASQYYDLYEENVKNPARDVRYRIGYVAYRSGDTEKAINEFKRAASDKDSVGIYASYYLGILYLKEGNKLYAQNAFDNARKSGITPELVEESSYQYAKVTYDLEQTELAINAMNAFVEDYPSSTHLEEINDLLSEAYLNTNNYNLAISHVEKAGTVNKNLQGIYQKATYLKGAEYFNSDNYPEAITLFSKSLKYPVDPEYTQLANLWMGETFSVQREFDKATPYYQAALSRSEDRIKENGLKARYGLGYSFYNTKQYDKALIHFKEYVDNSDKSRNSDYYEDAVLRLADCYYVEKRYNDALRYYSLAIKNNKVDNDYAHLQAGVVNGINGDVTSANREYDYIIDNYPTSRYFDDALFQQAQLNFENGKYEEAVAGFSKLIRQKPSSQYVPYAYLRRATSNYNLQKYDNSIADYQVILKDYPTHSIASEALLPLQEVLNVQGRSAEFSTYLNQFKAANPESQNVESLEFETAKNFYYNLEYNKTIDAFRAYVSSYPNNPKVPEARYFMAESYYRLNEYEPAKQLYEGLATMKNFEQYNRVIARLADIQTITGNRQAALTRYYQLASVAQNKKEQYNAWSGLMENYYELGRYDSATRYARLILERANVNVASQNKASLYIGKAAYARGDYATARDEFLATLNTARDQYGAEAQYLLGDIFYRDGKYQQSIETLISLNKNFEMYEQWVGESYLLLADNYIAMDDTFQAKGTLKSIIDNFPDEKIKERARKKLSVIQADEEANETSVIIESDTLN
ncbi:tetratricopeptide repeat protein [Fulvivirga sedimenti]|uniref:Tetratricopeptide repeat protein n=1 Tax=Fulvivirga sedimenti TaxID=2879465 RepID=A0A9X1HL61_9BACT|nr:tetratricopeptide repeat protein [Fulvivirga sedimenti]MCA6073331.1 tetratricopeptide repeat protein [Fulvivirga sedimenti]